MEVTPHEEQQQQHYALLYIIPVKYTVDELPAVTERVRNILIEHGCQITHEDTLGKRKLAYPIKRVFHGYYTIVECNLLPVAVAKLNVALQLAPEVLRHLFISRPERTAAELAKEKDQREAATAAAAAKQALRNGEAAPTPTITATLHTDIQTRVVPTQAADSDEGKVSLEELDKRLDELIDETIL